MTLEEIIRRKALADPRPLSWACTRLAQALRLLKAVEADMPESTAAESSLKIAVEYMLIELTEEVADAATR
jgi:hypothetical protein